MYSAPWGHIGFASTLFIELLSFKKFIWVLDINRFAKRFAPSDVTLLVSIIRFVYYLNQGW